jgi:hypothetical protein
MSFVVSPSFNLRRYLEMLFDHALRREVQHVQMPAKNASGRVSSKANQTEGCVPSGSSSFSEKLVKRATHRLSIPSQRAHAAIPPAAAAKA